MTYAANIQQLRRLPIGFPLVRLSRRSFEDLDNCVRNLAHGVRSTDVLHFRRRVGDWPKEHSYRGRRHAQRTEP